MSSLSKVLAWGIAICGLTVVIGLYFLKAWIPFFWILIFLAVLFLGIIAYKDQRFFKEFLTMKTTKQGMSMGALIVLVFGIMIFANLIGARHSKTFDFSISKSNSLSEQSVQLVKSLDSELKILFFYKQGVEGVEENRRAFRDLVRKYQDYSSNVQLDFVEMNERPDLVSEYEVDKGSGVVFINYKNRKNRIDKIEEQDLTSALLKVLQVKEKTIYYLVGHGERSLDEAREAEGMNSLKMMIENNRYQIKTLALSQSPQIPQDADLVMILAPRQAYLDFELKAIEEYLRQGGAAFIALEQESPHHLDALFSNLGVETENQYIVNFMAMGDKTAIDPTSPTLATQFLPNHPLTKLFKGQDFMLFRFPMSLKRSSTPSLGIQVDDIVRTNAQTMSFSDNQFKKSRSVGPFTIAMALSGKYAGSTSDQKEFKMVLTGDADFISNQLLFQNLNRDLIINSLAWLSNDEEMISISPKETQVTKIFMTDTKFGVFLWTFAIPLPLLLLAIAIVLKVRRRNA